jgi:hypothetical protein
MKAFSLGGFEGVGGAWKMPPTDETFDAEMRAAALGFYSPLTRAPCRLSATAPTSKEAGSTALKLAATVMLLHVFYPFLLAVYPDPADHRPIRKLD